MKPATLQLHAQDLARARAILRGSEADFAAFYEDSFARLYRFALRHCNDADLAEEITQDSLVRALQAMANYRGEASLFTWLCSIARNELQRHGRLDQRLARLEANEPLQALIDELEMAVSLEPAALVARAQLIRCVHGVLDLLPPAYAECLEGKYVLGLSMRDLALKLGRTEKAVESILGRAREAFRQAFLADATGADWR